MKPFDACLARLCVAFNSALAGVYATRDVPVWPLAAAHVVGALFGLWVLWTTRRG